MSEPDRRVAAIDCGTNSLRLLIADVPAGGRVVPLARYAEIVRLGEGVDRTGRLADTAIRRAFAVLDTYRALIDRAGVRATAFAATSATRDAVNAADFTVGATQRIGVPPRVLDGETEARLSFLGAVNGLAPSVATAQTEYLVVDVGGGSTEFVRGGPDQVRAAGSVDIGSVRLHERHGADRAAVDLEIRRRLQEVAANVGLDQIDALVGVGGTVTTLTAFQFGLARYRSEQVHGARLTAAGAMAACERMIAMSHTARRSFEYIPPGRADVIGVGAQIWWQVLAAVSSRNPGVAVFTSEADILDGLAATAAGTDHEQSGSEDGQV